MDLNILGLTYFPILKRRALALFSLMERYCVLLSILIQLEVISESGNVPSNDLEDPDFNSVFIVAMTKQHPRDSDIVGTS